MLLFCSGCLMSHGAALTDLRNSLSVGVKDGPQGHRLSDDRKVYNFVDENGVEFQLISEYHDINIDGAKFGSAPSNSCNYTEAFLKHNAAGMSILCEASGLEYHLAFDDSRTPVLLLIDSYDDVKPVSELIVNLFDVVGVIPIRRDGQVRLAEPAIEVKCGGWSLLRVDFPIQKNHNEQTYDEIYEAVNTAYTDMVRDSKFPNDLPDGALESVTPESYRNVYVNETLVHNSINERAQFFRNPEDGRYDIQIDDLLRTSVSVMGHTNFVPILDQLGCSHSYDKDGFLHWTLDSAEYCVRPNTQRTALLLYRDGVQVDELEILDQGEFVTANVDIDEFAALLGGQSCRIDAETGSLYFTAP